VILRI